MSALEWFGLTVVAMSAAVIAMEDRNQILTTRTSDVGEGIAAFLEKREPKYEDA